MRNSYEVKIDTGKVLISGLAGATGAGVISKISNISKLGTAAKFALGQTAGAVIDATQSVVEQAMEGKVDPKRVATDVVAGRLLDIGISASGVSKFGKGVSDWIKERNLSNYGYNKGDLLRHRVPEWVLDRVNAAGEPLGDFINDLSEGITSRMLESPVKNAVGGSSSDLGSPQDCSNGCSSIRMYDSVTGEELF